jgi:hypothetical protein
MGFFSGYKHDGGMAQGALAGLGALTAGTSNRLNKEATRVVAAFARGEAAEALCKGRGQTRACEIETDGYSLLADNVRLAETQPGENAVKVCIPKWGKLQERPDGRIQETTETQGVKSAASALLKVLRSGVGLRTAQDGTRMLNAKRSRTRVELPEDCLLIRLPSSEQATIQHGRALTRVAQQLTGKKMPTEHGFKVARDAYSETRKKRAKLEAERLKAEVAAQKERIKQLDAEQAAVREQLQLETARIVAEKKQAAKRAKSASANAADVLVEAKKRLAAEKKARAEQAKAQKQLEVAQAKVVKAAVAAPRPSISVSEKTVQSFLKPEVLTAERKTRKSRAKKK